MASLSLEAKIKAKAQELGFALCRFAKADLNGLHLEAFAEWLQEGKAGDMTPWLERSKARRSNPQEVLPEVQTVIVLAMNYWQGESTPKAHTGQIARYAWGDDYHPWIEKKLKLFTEFIQEEAPNPCLQKAYVDTGPVLERDFAAKAGVGWQGKSTMLIHPKLGTWFFLSVVYTTLELETDPPLESPRCGKCTRCLDACPTGAINPNAPYRLDARLCISYLTIEYRGAIPLELRPLIGDRIYGCDACLEACPWNRFAQASKEAVFQARKSVQAMPLRDYLALTEEDFRILFKNSPIKRTKHRGLLRNVCVALGNVGTAEDLPALEAVAQQEDAMIAEHASWAIEQICKKIERSNE